MDRREILNELAQIVAAVEAIGWPYGTREIAARAKGLIREVESWPIAFPPAPFVSDQCCERHHGECQLGSANQPFSRLCHCACHCPPEAPQQPAESPQQAALAHFDEIWNTRPADSLRSHQSPPEAPPQPATHFEQPHTYFEPLQASAPPARHIDTPDELLELLAGVSSDPQIEGLSLAQKASTMALLYAAKALQEIAGHVEDIDTALELVGGTWLAKAAQSPCSPVKPS